MYGMDFTGQYRSDLEKNLHDQVNVDLSGFKVNFARPLPPGRCRVGMLARAFLTGRLDGRVLEAQIKPGVIVGIYAFQLRMTIEEKGEFPHRLGASGKSGGCQAG